MKSPKATQTRTRRACVFTFNGINRYVAGQLAFALRMYPNSFVYPTGMPVRRFTVTVQEEKGGKK